MANITNCSGCVSSHFQEYMRGIFLNMFLAVGLSALTIYLMLFNGWISAALSVENNTVSLTPMFWVVTIVGVGIALYAQIRAFSLNPKIAKLFLFIYAISIGFVTAPVILLALNINPIVVLQAFLIAMLMFGCMALFGYKTQKDLSFMGMFLFIAMIGLIIAGIVSIFWATSTFILLVSVLGVIVFALFTAYDMQYLKLSYDQLGLERNDVMRKQMVVAGALHLYISFVAMFRYILTLLMNRD